MANDLTGNPWIIDTAFDSTEIADWNGPVRVQLMRWQEPTADDDLTITDNSGTTIFDENALAGGTGISTEWGFGGNGVVFNGFNVTVIDGGTLYVYIA